MAASPGTPGADIRATEGWDIALGNASNVVAVVDTGIDYNHPDLAANIWSAPAPFTVVIGGVSITCAAGTHGFNAITKTCDPMDDHDHGTHVSGTIGAIGNNAIGVAGVNWDVVADGPEVSLRRRHRLDCRRGRRDRFRDSGEGDLCRHRAAPTFESCRTAGAAAASRRRFWIR